MQELKCIKTNLMGEVDDVVETLEELHKKMLLLGGNVYQNNMLVFVKNKNAIYKIKVVS